MIFCATHIRGRANAILVRSVAQFAQLKIVQVSAGGFFSAFLTSEGQVYTCGSSSYGECGDGSNTNHTSVYLVESIKDEPIRYLGTGYYHMAT